MTDMAPSLTIPTGYLDTCLEISKSRGSCMQDGSASSKDNTPKETTESARSLAQDGAAKVRRKGAEPRIRDPERTRAKILSAARDEFCGMGFNGARVDDIADRAKVNKRLLYHYFGNKEALYSAVLLDARSGTIARG